MLEKNRYIYKMPLLWQNGSGNLYLAPQHWQPGSGNPALYNMATTQHWQYGSGNPAFVTQPWQTCYFKMALAHRCVMAVTSIPSPHGQKGGWQMAPLQQVPPSQWCHGTGFLSAAEFDGFCRQAGGLHSFLQAIAPHKLAWGYLGRKKKLAMGQ